MEVFFMQDDKKILKLRFANKGQRYIDDSLQLSRNTVKKIYDVADQAGLFWNDALYLDNAQIHSRLFHESLEINLTYQQPDYEYVHKELTKVSVSLQMLWEECVQTCKVNKKQGNMCPTGWFNLQSLCILVQDRNQRSVNV